MTAGEPALDPGVDRLEVALGDRSYDVLVGSGLLGSAGERLRPLVKTSRVVVITDETVAALHLDELLRGLEAADIEAKTFVVPAGEATKSFTQLSQLVEDILASGIERGTPLVALGGGVVGDLAGFAAAVTLRGLDFIQVPTTLLSQVDSSVGGKTAINVPQGKNLVGAFHQPRMVLADSGVLLTLPRRQLLAGYAETVKIGLIEDPSFFAWLEGHGTSVCDGDPAALRHAVLTACAAKAQVVAADERESGVRALLNLGHTFGHALEAEVGYGDELLHGEAVAIGMVMAFELSAHLGLCPAAEAARVRRHLASVGLPTGLESLPGRTWNADVLIEHMTRDKKVRNGRIAFVLARGIGQAFLTDEVELGEVANLLNVSIAA